MLNLPDDLKHKKTVKEILDKAKGFLNTRNEITKAVSNEPMMRIVKSSHSSQEL